MSECFGSNATLSTLSVCPLSSMSRSTLLCRCREHTSILVYRHLAQKHLSEVPKHQSKRYQKLSHHVAQSFPVLVVIAMGRLKLDLSILIAIVENHWSQQQIANGLRQVVPAQNFVSSKHVRRTLRCLAQSATHGRSGQLTLWPASFRYNSR